MSGERTGAQARAQAQAGDGRGRVTAWLAGHSGGVPDALGKPIQDAVEGVEGEGAIHDTLVASAVRQLDEALRMGGDRAAATPLLVADALLTYAIEAAAAGNASLEGLAADVARQLSGLIAE